MNCVSLYTGCGGLDLGFHDAGFKTVWANDIDPFALKTYAGELARRKLGKPEIFCGDISKAALPCRGAAEVVIGGPPCQGFSVAGRMDPNDPRSRQVWEFFKVVDHLQPRAFVMENVKSLAVNTRWTRTMHALVEEGEKLGFRTRLLVLNAADYGVPQLRERMFLVGLKEAVMPTPTKSLFRTTVREALSELPSYGKPGNHSVCRAIVTAAKTPVMRKSPFAGMLFNGQGRPMDLDAPALTLPASMGGNRTPIIDQKSLEDGSEQWVVSYHSKLMAGGEITSKIPKRLRRLTVEEAAHLQGFPIGMSFEGSQCAKFRQIGNSVPPALGAAVAKSLRSVLDGGSASDEWRNDQKCWVAEDTPTYGTSRTKTFCA
jgi:DNA (cytosine-5)-methyltransferase 1